MNKGKERIAVRDVMKPEVDIVDGMLTVTEAMRDMDHHDTRTLIVDKRDDEDEYELVEETFEELISTKEDKMP